MVAAKVIASIETVRRADCLVDIKFMLVEILGGKDAGCSIIAADLINADIGNRVIISRGSSARQVLNHKNVPIDAVIIKNGSTDRYGL